MSPTVTIITATTGNPLLARNIQSVRNQTWKDIEHLIVIDGPEYFERVMDQFSIPWGDEVKQHFLNLPWNTGKDRYNGHRIYGAATYLARGDYFIFLDDDNTLEPTHVEDCLGACKTASPIYGESWAYSLRNIVDKEGKVLCQDNCESLGKWASVIHPQDFFIDVNCYFLPRPMAVAMSPVWYCKFREPGQPEIDRKMMAFLRHNFPKFECTHKYTVNYTVGNTPLSVTPEFFERGNAEMMKRYNGVLPWVKK
jgi:glycosyltransferase involved in cell wall biosynthesis